MVERKASQNVLITIRKSLPYLNPALKKIGKYILDQPAKVKLQKIQSLAKACQVSESTITRFVKEINFNSFQELKIAVAEISTDDLEDLAVSKKSVYDDITKDDSVEDIINKISVRNIETLNNTTNVISANEIKKAVRALERADAIAIYCAGSSAVTGQNALMRFYRLGKPCWLYTDPVQQAVSASLLKPGSVALGISSSGKTRSTIDALKRSKESNATTMCITDSIESPITKYSDLIFFTASQHSSFLQDSMISRLSQLLIIDILYASYAVKHFNTSLSLIERSASAVKQTKYLSKVKKS
jgi:DNA-binding MurR/RpiR family transcriptional regulator